MTIKPINILIGIPSPDWIAPAFALDNLPAIVAYTKNNLVNLGDLFIRYQQGVRTDKNRNYILKAALDKGDIDYILWLDTDMLYPQDIICRYLAYDFDVMGCLYFKRSSPYSPVGYVKGDNPKKPYKPIDFRTLPENQMVTVDGLGFGGMMVSMRVYEKLGDDKWMNYGKSFHLPFDSEDGLTHDLEFCKMAQKYGFDIRLHTGVRPGHIAETVITERNWEPAKSKERITVIIPTIDMEQGSKVARHLKAKAGVECEVVIAEDVNRSGFIATVNTAVKQYPSDYYVYTAQDAFVGRDWLKIALETMKREKAGLLGFNNGRWGGKLAAFGMVKHDFMVSNYGGDLFFNGYHSHYADVELTLIARERGLYTYNPSALMVEVDYDKDTKSVNRDDKLLFSERKQMGFDGKVKNLELLNLFS